MDKIDELQAKVKELEQEKHIAELRLEIARLEAEVAEIKAKYPWYPMYPWWYPNPWGQSPVITYTITSASSGTAPKTWTIDGQEYAVVDAPPPGALEWTPEREAKLRAIIERANP